ncbi:hypothetical protein C8J56DRAFT_928009 [Mycena floridula]|nr:hypothetical protein C8J56DRAFT_928009 [Mycena floridula]
MLCRRAVFQQCRLLQRRYNSTESWTERPRDFEQSIGRPADGSRSAHCKAWSFIESIGDVYSMIREIEKKYGPVAEFRFFKDRNLSSNYQIHFDIRFVSTESLERVPIESEVVQVALPPLPTNPLGGPSLEDIQWSLSPYSPELDALIAMKTLNDKGKPHRVLDFKIQRSRTDVFTIGQAPRPPAHEVGRGFVHWSGFYPLKPLPAGTAITNDLDHPIMRYSVRKWSRKIGIPDPLETVPEPIPIERPVEVAPQPTVKPPPAPVKRTSGSLPTLPPATPMATLLEKKVKVAASTEMTSQLQAAEALANLAKIKKPKAAASEPKQKQKKAAPPKKEKVADKDSLFETLVPPPEPKAKPALSLEDINFVRPKAPAKPRAMSPRDFLREKASDPGPLREAEEAVQRAEDAQTGGPETKAEDSSVKRLKKYMGGWL